MGTRDEQLARRKRIADEMASFMADSRYDKIDEIAQKYNVSRSTVLTACRQHQVKVGIARDLSAGSRKRIIQMLRDGARITAIVTELDETYVRIHQVRKNAIRDRLLKD